MGSSAYFLSPFLLSSLVLLLATSGDGAYPESGNCKSLECPAYKVIHTQKEFEIRKYVQSTWMSTKPIMSMSYKEASNIGFDQLFAYIEGKNTQGVKVGMTAPVLVDITNSTGPFCNSTFVMHFYVPKKYQSNPPGSSVVSPVMWPSEKYSYVAIRRFGGMMEDDSTIAYEAMKLLKSLKGSEWEEAVMKSMEARKNGYSVAGYNSPFEIVGRVNEIVFPF